MTGVYPDRSLELWMQMQKDFCQTFWLVCFGSMQDGFELEASIGSGISEFVQIISSLWHCLELF